MDQVCIIFLTKRRLFETLGLLGLKIGVMMKQTFDFMEGYFHKKGFFQERYILKRDSVKMSVRII